MTQMGLDYMKHKETMRHNLQTENVDRRNATVNERNATSNERNATTNEKDASTRAYTASFKPREVAAQEKQATASMSQANTAASRFKLDSQYREREMKAAEQQASANMLKAKTSEAEAYAKYSPDGTQYQLEKLKSVASAIKNMSPVQRSAYAATYLKDILQEDFEFYDQVMWLLGSLDEIINF